MNKVVIGCLVGAMLGFAGLASAQPLHLNEIVMNDVGADDMEFVELCGEPNTDLTRYSVIVIEGEGTGKGLIDRAFDLTGLIGLTGFYTLADAGVTCADQTKTDTFENGGETILLVADFTGVVGMDLDADDDCIADGAFPGTILDGVATALPSSGDCAGYYGVPTLGPDTGNDGKANFDVAGVARCADCTGGWGMICLAGTEGAPVCLDANPDDNYVVSAASPCTDNLCPPVPAREMSWGAIKSVHR